MAKPYSVMKQRHLKHCRTFDGLGLHNLEIRQQICGKWNRAQSPLFLSVQDLKLNNMACIWEQPSPSKIIPEKGREKKTFT